jgi:hypothetical protein
MIRRSSKAARSLYLELAARGFEMWVEDVRDDGEPPDAPVQFYMAEEIPEAELERLAERIKAHEIGLWTACVSLNDDWRAVRKEGAA